MKPYKRYFKEDVRDHDKDYLKHVVTRYLYDKNEKNLEDGKKFILQFNDNSREEIDNYVNDLIKTIPDVGTTYNKFKKEFEDFFYVIKDIVDANIDTLYSLYDKKRIRKNKEQIKAYYDLASKNYIDDEFLKDMYKKWYKGVSSGKALVKKINGYYEIPKAIAKNCRVTDDVRDMAKWKVKIVRANNGGKIGEWEEVGYIAISGKDNTLIPIARSDEHQSGFELLWYYQKKKVIDDVKNFETIFPLHNSYFHLGNEISKENEYVQKMRLQAIKNWLKYTKVDSKVNLVGNGQWEGNFSKFVKDFDGLSLEDAFTFARTGVSAKDRGIISLSKQGQQIVDYIEDIWKFYKKKNDLMFANIGYLLEKVKPYIKKDQFDKFYENYVVAEGHEDYDKGMDIVFAFWGIKNTIHTRLNSGDKTLEKLFGSIDSAKEEFNRLGNLR